MYDKVFAEYPLSTDNKDMHFVTIRSIKLPLRLMLLLIIRTSVIKLKTDVPVIHDTRYF